MESVPRSHRVLARLFDVVSFPFLGRSVRLRCSRVRMGSRTQAARWLEFRRCFRLYFASARCSRMGCAANEKTRLEEMRHLAAAPLPFFAFGEKSGLRSSYITNLQNLFRLQRFSGHLGSDCS